MKGKRFTRKLSRAFEQRLPALWKSHGILEEHAVEIAREVTRGAIHVVDDKPLPIENLIKPVTEGIVAATERAGVNPMESLRGAGQGIIQGASETGIDLSEATRQTLAAARDIAEKSGISAEEAVIQAGEGILMAAESIGPEAAAEVYDELPDEVLNNREASDSQTASTSVEIHSGS